MNRTAIKAAPVVTLDKNWQGLARRVPNKTGQGSHRFTTGANVAANGREYRAAVYQTHRACNLQTVEVTLYLNGRAIPEAQLQAVRTAVIAAYVEAFGMLAWEAETAPAPAPEGDAAAIDPNENIGSVPAEKPVRYIDMTPTWRGILPLYIAAIEAGTFEGRKAAMAELYRMADLADSAVESGFDSIIAKVDPVNLQSIANGANYEFAKRGHIDAAKRRLAAMAEAPAAR